MENSTNKTPTSTQETTAAPAAEGWTYERRLAFYIFGKMALQGALSDVALDAFEFVMDGMVDSISEGLEELRGEGSLETIIDHADLGRTVAERMEKES